MAEKGPFKFNPGGIALNLTLIFGLGILVSFVLRLFGVGEETARSVQIAVFCLILFANPLEAYRESQSRRQFVNKLAIGAFVGLAVSLAIGPLGQEEVAAESESTWQKLHGSLGILLVLPLLILAPLLESLLNKSPGSVKLTELIGRAAFPAFLIASIMFTLMVAGALFLLGANLQIGSLVMLGAIVLAVTETWATPEDERGADDTVRPPPASEKEACADFVNGLRNSFTSILFMSTILFMSLHVMSPLISTDFDVQPIRSIVSLLAFAVGMPLVFMMFVGLGMLTAHCLAYLVALWQSGGDNLSVERFCDHTSDRLLVGGLSYVMPASLDD